jgi:drug/metabolite transporter (DMT)-like permease
MLGAAALFAAMNVTARFGALALPWPMVAASRFAMGLPLVYVAAKRRGVSLRVTELRLAWSRTVLGTISAALTFAVLGSPGMPLGDAVTIFSASPIGVALLSWPLLGEPVRRSAVVALVMASSGVVLVAQPTLRAETLPALMALGAAASSALAMVFLRRVSGRDAPEAVVWHYGRFGAVVFGAASLFVFRVPTAVEAASLVATGVFGSVAQLLMTRAYARDKAVRVSVYGYAALVLTRAFGVIFFGERPPVTATLGSLLVIGSGLVLSFGPTLALYRDARAR